MGDFIRKLVPTNDQFLFGSAFSAVGTAASYLFGWNEAFEALLILMVLDYLSGVLAAYINPGMKLDSAVGFRGIAKKVMILLLVALAHWTDRAMGMTVVQSVVTLFFVGNEGLSVIENASNAGLPIPKRLKATLEQFHERGDAAKQAEQVDERKEKSNESVHQSRPRAGRKP